MATLTRNRFLAGWLATATSFGISASAAPADEMDKQRIGVTDTDIVIGSCVALSGALKERGHEVTNGANSYFSYINDQGGVFGRKIRLATCDDSYDAEKAIQCFNGCLKDKVFAGSFFVGSAPISKYVRMAEVHKMPLIGFCTGTPAIYEPHPTEFVLRSGYHDEVQRMIDELTRHGIKRVAVIYQNDAFGAAIRESAIKVLQANNLKLVAEASYPRNSGPAEAESAFNTVRAADPEAVLLGATSTSLTNVIKKRDEQKWNALFATVSVADDYLSELGKNADGVIVTQVAPPLDDRLPAMVLYNKLRNKYKTGTKATATGFEAFLNAEVLVEALKRAGKDLTRDKFIAALESMHNYDLGAGSNFKVSFTPHDHRGFYPSSIYFTVVRNGVPVPISGADWSRLTELARTASTKLGSSVR